MAFVIFLPMLAQLSVWHIQAHVCLLVVFCGFKFFGTLVILLPHVDKEYNSFVSLTVVSIPKIYQDRYRAVSILVNYQDDETS